ncbi:16S rRNA (guanine(966)-N(2))-methyltransferase RsmD [Liquorilactobacillus vini]|uniref:Methyltransferase n=1 Tax=Liquorilactobacillus vini DSM 20605 TaxID=1133569 RepID=A0A0R2CGN3_9LACO|nr:16S rRNA (guanine(966)-N(2))-methyltransferase RsmD [Liquorilactobacillus vini]KRM89172.1 methyltransferase [Liquorilactobacillus vini DSM 20605]
MRVISGKYRGRKLKAVPGQLTRPTTDKVKESVFNMLGNSLAGQVLDLYAGSGSLGIEAVSRGAQQAILVDRQFQAVKTIKENIRATKEERLFQVYKADSFKILNVLAKRQLKFSYLFLDPPYKKQKISQVLQRFDELKLWQKDGIVVCETDQFAQLPAKIAGCKLWKRADYGITEVSIYHFRGDDQ